MSSPLAPRRLRVAVTGGTGLVGSALSAALAARGHDAVVLTRRRDLPPAGGVRFVAYDPASSPSIASALEGADAVVHLAGHNLFDGRWDEARRALIRSSRVDATRALVAAIGSMARRPSVLVSASAVGVYGMLPPERTVDESSPPADDFLAEVCRAWEAEALAARAHGVRTVLARLGVVLSREGGAVKEMSLPFKLFVGGPVGRGTQVVSWVHLDDVVGMLTEMVEDERWSGPVNVVAPRPVPNKAFAKAMGRAMRRPAFLPTPGFALRLLLGPVASLVTAGQRVLPTVASRLGYAFRFADIDAAMAHLFRA